MTSGNGAGLSGRRWHVEYEVRLPGETDDDGRVVAVKPVGSDGALVVPADVTLSNDQFVVTLTIDVRDSIPICTGYEVRRVDGGAMEMATTDVARGVNLRRLIAYAVAQMAVQPIPGSSAAFTNAGPATIQQMIEPLRRRRDPVSDDRLRDFATRYLSSYQRGRMDEFAHSLPHPVSERQAWNLVRLARDRGFLPPKGAKS